MLYISLTLSVVLLGAVNLIVAKWRNPVPATIGLGVAFSILPTCVIMLGLPALELQAVFLCLALFILLVPGRGRRLYLPLSCFATLLAYALFAPEAIHKYREITSLRQDYPLESLEERLPVRVASNATPPKNTEELEMMENAVESDRHNRAQHLRMLHERSVSEFVGRAGFGVGRMVRLGTNREAIEDNPRDDSTVPQPDYFNPYTHPSGELSEKPTQWDSVRMSRFHFDGVLDFLNPKGFGYFKNRREVAGFQNHGMSKAQVAPAPWLAAKIELIGVVIHEKPVAYLSANLPKMDELRKALTRPLDAFEMEALEKLRKGEDLFARGTADKARMVGAIRATKQCLECHGASRGDLLGAFSYGFRREER